MSTSWHSYPKIYNVGHRALQDFFTDGVIVQEKVDGSQFSFGLFPEEGERPAGYRARSKGAQIHLAAPEKMFVRACEVIQTLPLREGWTYRGEYLNKPKHNVMAYERTPINHIILFDVNTGEESYLSPWELQEEAARIGLESVPVIYEGHIGTTEMFRSMLDRVSVLGGQKIEGVVAKNYTKFGTDKKALMAKFVSEAFKEVHSKEWGEANPSQGDIVQKIGARLRTPARWNKAIQRMREAGTLQDSPVDIGPLIKLVHTDVVEEEKDLIMAELWKHFKDSVIRSSTAGLPQWYKEELVKLQFEQEEVPA